VIKGFIVGLALTIIIGQVPALLGIEKGTGEFFQALWHILGELGSIDALTAVVGVGSLALLLALKRFVPAAPGSLIAVAVGIALAEIFNLSQHGVDIVGHINGGLPSFGKPDVTLHDYGTLVAGGVGVMLVGFAEGLGAAKTYAERDHYPLNVNRELIGLGAANVASGLSQGMVVNGSLSKTAVNGSAGARTQLSGLVVAVLVIVTLLVLTGLFEQLPEATLAAVVIAAVIELVDVPSLARFYRVYSGRVAGKIAPAARPDFIAAVAAMFGVLVFGTLPGLFIGIGVSFLLLLYRASRPHIALLGKVPGSLDQYGDMHRHPENIVPDGVSVLRIEAGLFFANADAVRARIVSAAEGNRAVILDAETVPFVDITAAEMLASVSSELERRGVQLLMARDVARVRDVLTRMDEDAGLTATYPSVQAAIDALASAPQSDEPWPADPPPPGTPS
jgi:SulP family sulfate permease